MAETCRKDRIWYKKKKDKIDRKDEIAEKTETGIKDRNWLNRKDRKLPENTETRKDRKL